MISRKVLRLGSVIVAVAFLATACATKAGTGALVGGGTGAVLGAGIGALAGGRTGAVMGGALGAAAGAGTGALIGNYMDKQEKAMKEVKGAQVQRQGDQLLVKFNSAILFDTGNGLLPRDYEALKARKDRWIRANKKMLRLAQQEVHQRGFPMVNMGNNGNVAQIGSFFQHIQPRSGHGIAMHQRKTPEVETGA